MISNDSKIYDIAIIGLGPAGALFAALLNNKFSVIAFDKKCNYDDISFRKPCGGLIAPDAQKILKKIGLKIPAEICESPVNNLLKALDINTKEFAYYQNSYINITGINLICG